MIGYKFTDSKVDQLLGVDYCDDLVQIDKEVVEPINIRFWIHESIGNMMARWVNDAVHIQV